MKRAIGHRTALIICSGILFAMMPRAALAQNALELFIDPGDEPWFAGRTHQLKVTLKNTSPVPLIVDTFGNLAEPYYLSDIGGPEVLAIETWGNFPVSCIKRPPTERRFSRRDFVRIEPGESFIKILTCRVAKERSSGPGGSKVTYRNVRLHYFTTWIVSPEFSDRVKRAFPRERVWFSRRSLASNPVDIVMVR